MSTESPTPSFDRLVKTVHRLRAPGGCPWDRAQTHQSLRQYLIEEAFEVVDVLDKIDSPEALKNPSISGAFREELGDLLMQVVLHTEITREEGAFDIADVADTLNEKLIRRHPHVFGPESEREHDAESAFQRWEKQKAKEKSTMPDASVLDGVPSALPALQRASRVLEKVTKVGFQWKDIQGPVEKVDEEIDELKQALEKGEKAEIEHELGDALFTLCNVAFHMKINPEDALRTTLRRFEKRFQFIEKKLKDQGRTPDQSNLEEMDRFWNEAKRSGL